MLKERLLFDDSAGSHGDVQQLSREVEANDAWLVRQCQNGNQESFRYLYRRHQKKVRSLLYQLCGPVALDDLVQEVFLRVWHGLSKLRNPDRFSTWLYRITWNVASDRRRTLAREKASMAWGATVETKTDGQSHCTLSKLHAEQLVQQALEQLPLKQRVVVVLHDLQDLPQKQIAQVLHLPVGTIKSRLFHARQQLRQFLQAQGVDL